MNSCTLLILAVIILAAVTGKIAYELGVNDGFMATKEPGHPGYSKAVRILQRRGKIPGEG